MSIAVKPNENSTHIFFSSYAIGDAYWKCWRQEWTAAETAVYRAGIPHCSRVCLN